MQRTNCQVTGFARFQGVTSRVDVPDFAHDNHVRVGSHEVTHSGREVEVHGRVHVNLAGVRDAVFHRVFDGVDSALEEVHLTDGRRQGRGLTGTGRTTNQAQAIRLRHGLAPGVDTRNTQAA